MFRLPTLFCLLGAMAYIKCQTEIDAISYITNEALNDSLSSSTRAEFTDTTVPEDIAITENATTEQTLVTDIQTTQIPSTNTQFVTGAQEEMTITNLVTDPTEATTNSVTVDEETTTLYTSTKTFVQTSPYIPTSIFTTTTPPATHHPITIALPTFTTARTTLCRENEIYSCLPLCPRTCNTPLSQVFCRPVPSYFKLCRRGCTCKPGYLLEKTVGKCVKACPEKESL